MWNHEKFVRAVILPPSWEKDHLSGSRIVVERDHGLVAGVEIDSRPKSLLNRDIGFTRVNLNAAK